MGKGIEIILQAFTHLAREIQVYFLSGFLIAINLFMIDYFYFKGSCWSFIKCEEFIIPLMLMVYIFGQFSMAFFSILEIKKIKVKLEAVNKSLVKNWEVADETKIQLPALFEKYKDGFDHFVERFHILVHMRWTLSSACTINFVVNLIFLLRDWLLCQPAKWQVWTSVLVYFSGAFLFYILSVISENEYAKRIENFSKGI